MVALLRSALARVRLEEDRGARVEIRARLMALGDPSSAMPVSEVLRLSVCVRRVLDANFDEQERAPPSAAIYSVDVARAREVGMSGPA